MIAPVESIDFIFYQFICFYFDSLLINTFATLIYIFIITTAVSPDDSLQVSHLVVLYEAGQQGQAMPDLVDNITLVLSCVSNLASVAEQTALQSNDATFIVSSCVTYIRT